MLITGESSLPFPVAQVWEALLDPQVLVATIPGCERLETAGEHAYEMTVSAGVAAIRGTYDGSCVLSDLVPHESLVMSLRGAGAPGTIDASVRVRFSESEGSHTVIGYEADAVVGGMVGGVGQRMLTSVSKRMAGEFFDNVGNALARPPVPGSASAPEPGHTVPGQVFTAPAPAHSRDDFLKGIAVGAGLVLIGVVAGSVLGRRR
ncbi:SRPBCC family protein [Nocardioides sp.]|uniref:SRPBCC family protein n=1 Tax=Nocardioides sp. TaxID=35761 RepID=UPI003D0D341E